LYNDILVKILSDTVLVVYLVRVNELDKRLHGFRLKILDDDSSGSSFDRFRRGKHRVEDGRAGGQHETMDWEFAMATDLKWHKIFII
jgi:hypothetical protein